MNKKLIYIVLILFSFFNSSSFMCQKKSELLKKQEKILLEKIENTKVLINQTRATKKLTLSEINIVNRQIRYRQKLIDNYNFQLRKMDEKIHAKFILYIVEVEKYIDFCSNFLIFTSKFFRNWRPAKMPKITKISNVWNFAIFWWHISAPDQGFPLSNWLHTQAAESSNIILK